MNSENNEIDIEKNASLLHIKTDEPAKPVSPLLYGIFYEDINHAADGGIYAELIRNRSFEDTIPPEGCTVTNGIMRTPNGWETKFDDSDKMPGWKLSVGKPSKAEAFIDTKVILNNVNPHSLRIETECADGGYVNIINEGYWGMKFDKGARYNLSFFAKADNQITTVNVSLQDIDGNIYASQTITGITNRWKKHKCVLTAKDSTKDGRLSITISNTGKLWIDFVSLFPEITWKHRKNGLRSDLARMLDDMKPAFVRFPGGCFVEGITPDTAYRWKNTIGPIHKRKGHWNLWGYRSTNGLGYHEYLQMCEDLGAEPMYVFNCGMTCQARKGDAVPLDELDEWIQDTLDAIEYANGPVTSKWGAIRAKAGHPKPFDMKFMEIGNENYGPDYEERYKKFYNALKEHYPEITLITNAPVSDTHMEILDEHYYPDTTFFISNWKKYDSYDREGPKIYVGEYACTQGCGQGNLSAALSEAAFMIGMERNSDVVTMASYAPLFVNINDRTWNPDAICFDNSSCYGTPSYHVQAMFAQNRPDETFSNEFNGPVNENTYPDRGCIGLSTWDAKSEYKDIRVTRGDNILYESNFRKSSDEWNAVRGKWKIIDGAYRQTSDTPDTLAIAGDTNWKDYTISLKARKLSGTDGFVVMFNVNGSDNYIKWNIGVVSNAIHTVTALHKGKNITLGTIVQGSIEAERWYDIQVESYGRKIRCFLDDELIHDIDIPPMPVVAAVAGRVKTSGEIILKAVNVSDVQQTINVEIDKISNSKLNGIEIILTSASGDDENTISDPLKIAPITHSVFGLKSDFNWTLQANSLTILKLNIE